MQLTDTGHQLFGIMAPNLEKETAAWLSGKLEAMIRDRSARDLYLTYTLLATKVSQGQNVHFPGSDEALENYLKTHRTSLLEIARMYVLSSVLDADKDYFLPKVAQLIQVADTGELKTFLRYLFILPHAGEFRQVAVEALRTNIATIFDAIALDNPYPAKYFTEAQWNQMYLKAAFMQRDLDGILEVDRRANKDLARIISDYAHERWAASRDVDPMFWRPVSSFIGDELLPDMKRLLESDNPRENMAGALCCFYSGQKKALELLQAYPELSEMVHKGKVRWNNLKE